MQRALQAGGVSIVFLAALGLLAACSERDAPDDETNPVHPPEIVRIVPASEAIAGAHIPTLDPATMVDAEIQKVLGSDPRCEFRYTSEGRPVLAATARPDGGARDGVVKLNGHLVVLGRTSPGTGELALAADRVRLTVTPAGGAQAIGAAQREADVIFEIGDKLRVGYRGYYRCTE